MAYLTQYTTNSFQTKAKMLYKQRSTPIIAHHITSQQDHKQKTPKIEKEEEMKEDLPQRPRRPINLQKIMRDGVLTIRPKKK